MPLDDGYEVVIGDYEHYERDEVNDYGQYYHGNLYVKAVDDVYRCAIIVSKEE